MKIRRCNDYPFYPMYEVMRGRVVVGMLERRAAKQWAAYRGSGFSCHFYKVFPCKTSAARAIVAL